jgi:hypothetical protein
MEQRSASQPGSVVSGTHCIKFEYAQQAQVVYTFKHIQVNLMKTNAATWFNKKSKKPSTNTKIHKD